MVGSVLMQRMREEGDFAGLEPVFFSTSNVGGAAPEEAGAGAVLHDARDLKRLAACEVLISCQGGDYTTEVFAPLRKSRTGAAIGSTPHPRCAWRTTRRSFSIPSTRG